MNFAVVAPLPACTWKWIKLGGKHQQRRKNIIKY